MAEAQGDEEMIFVYMGGNQRVPNGVRRAKIHKSVKNIPRGAFQYRYQLIYVEFHDGVEIIEKDAFYGCRSLMGPIQLLGVKIIKYRAFVNCFRLTDVIFGDKLETIEQFVFNSTPLKKIRIPSVRTIEEYAFSFCKELTDVECGGALETLQEGAFHSCPKLKRIALPLKGGMIEDRAFRQCPELATVDLVGGGIHNTVASLNLDSWRSEMNNEIIRISQTLPTTDERRMGGEIQRWLRRVISQFDYYKTAHKALMKEAATLLELALWKANLDVNGGDSLERERHRTRGQRKRARKEICVTSGASIVIKNVLPFLQLVE